MFLKFAESFLFQPVIFRGFIVRVSGVLGLSGFRVNIVDLRARRLAISGSLRSLLGRFTRCLSARTSLFPAFQPGEFFPQLAVFASDLAIAVFRSVRGFRFPLVLLLLRFRGCRARGGIGVFFFGGSCRGFFSVGVFFLSFLFGCGGLFVLLVFLIVGVFFGQLARFPVFRIFREKSRFEIFRDRKSVV